MKLKDLKEDKRGVTKESKRLKTVLRRLNKTLEKFDKISEEQESYIGGFDEFYISLTKTLEDSLETMNKKINFYK